MRLVVVSDTHGLHNQIQGLPEGDVLVHAGDFMNSGFDVEDILSFNNWLGKQNFAHCVVCAGNHDRLFQMAPNMVRPLLTVSVRPQLCVWSDAYDQPAARSAACMWSVKWEASPALC